MSVSDEMATYESVLVANVSDGIGRVRVSEGMKVLGSPTIVSTELRAPDASLGHLWLLEENQVLELVYEHPADATDVSLELFTVGWSSTPARLAVRFNSGQWQEDDAPPDLKRKSHVITPSSPLPTGNTSIKIGARSGRIGIQMGKICYREPYPSVQTIDDEGTTTFRVLMPTTGVTIPQGGELTLRWSTEGVPRGTVGFEYREERYGLAINTVPTPVIRSNGQQIGRQYWRVPPEIQGTTQIVGLQSLIRFPVETKRIYKIPVTTTMQALFSPACEYVLYKDGRGDIAVHDLVAQKECWRFQADGPTFRRTILWINSQYVMLFYFDSSDVHRLEIWNHRSQEMLATFPLSNTISWSASPYESTWFLSESAPVLVYSSNTGAIETFCWSNNTTSSIQVGDSETRVVLGISPDANLIAYQSSFSNNDIPNLKYYMMFDRLGKKCLWTHEGSIGRVWFSPSSKRVVTLVWLHPPSSPAIPDLFVLESSTGKVHFDMPEIPGARNIYAAAISNDDSLLAVSIIFRAPTDTAHPENPNDKLAFTGMIIVFDLNSRSKIMEIPGPCLTDSMRFASDDSSSQYLVYTEQYSSVLGLGSIGTYGVKSSKIR
jgi:hypothetical protein